METINYFVLILAFCLVRCDLNDKWEEFREWKKKYNKNYGSVQEEVNRYIVWRANFDYVQEHNNDPKSQFRLETNEYADAFKTTRQKIDINDIERKEKVIQHNLSFVPSSFDWRQKGAVTPVKNQGMMGSAFPFVATECMEGYNFIKNKHLVELSEKEVIDCCTRGSGQMSPIFDCIHQIGGLCSAAAYPTKASPGQCRNGSCQAVVDNKGTMEVPKGREDQLLLAVLQNPVLAAVNAGQRSFQLYKSGVYNDPDCSPIGIDHVVQIVGYGVQNGTDYWIVRNSWGANWGMNGYILMSRNKNNQCGIASAASYPV